MTGFYPGKLIAFVSNSAWSVYNFRLDVIRALLREGHRILVIAKKDEYADQLISAGCQFVSIDFNNRTMNPLADLLFYRRLKMIYAFHKPDFIFHYVVKPNIYGSLAAAATSIPSVAVVTGLGYSFAKRNALFYLIRTLYWFALRKSQEVWFLNKEDAAVFISEKIVAIEKMKVIHGEGVNINFYSADKKIPKHDCFTFIMSTRLLKSKGITLYVDAARILKRKNYPVRFELIGFYEDRHPDSIPAADIDRWQSEGIIEYRGYKPDVRPFLRKAHCLVFPSYYNEGVPRCLMEAASMELPVITSSTQGCRELVLPNQSGFLCRPKDPFDLAEKMENMFLLSDVQRQLMGQAGRKHVTEKYSVKQLIAEYFLTLKMEPAD